LWPLENKKVQKITIVKKRIIIKNVKIFFTSMSQSKSIAAHPALEQEALISMDRNDEGRLFIRAYIVYLYVALFYKTPMGQRFILTGKCSHTEVLIIVSPCIP